jgi:hypothetical protein
MGIVEGMNGLRDIIPELHISPPVKSVVLILLTKSDYTTGLK